MLLLRLCVFFFKQKTAYELRISDWSSDVCSSDLGAPVLIRISGDYSKDKSDPRGGHRLITSLATGAPVLDNVFDTRGGLNDPKQDIVAYGLAMNVTAELSDKIGRASCRERVCQYV